MNGGFSSGQQSGGNTHQGMAGDANAQLSLNQAITRCSSCFEVLQLLGEVKQSDMIPSAANMATAMHRIASTGAQQPDPVKAQVLGDMRFRSLVLGVEERLERMPQDFGEQHLANVVWGAAKLRLKREPLFNLVQREVLSERRRLSDFSPQQLAAIAWAFAMMAFDAPFLFEAVQEEAGRQPVLARMLEQAGLLRRSESAMPNDRNRVVWSGAVGQQQAQHQAQQQAVQQAQQAQREQGNQQYGQQQKPGAPGQWSHPGQGQQMHQSGHNANQGPVGVGAGGLPRGIIGDSSGSHGSSGMSAKQSGNSQSATVGAPPPVGQQGQGSLGGFAAAARPQGVSAGSAPGPNEGSALPGTGGVGGSGEHADGTKSDMAAAAEQHRKEMEEKQRQVLGDEDGGATCPLCCEELDSTDMSFLPCPCGYQVCLLCFNKIQNEGNKQCPACRTEYNEENFKTQAPPEKKKKSEDADLGWETGNKKKANQKKSPPLTFPGFAPKVAEMLLQCHEQGIVVRGELDERVMEDLKHLPERGGIAVLSEFMKKDMTRIRNKSAFLNGIIIRVQEELQNDKSHAGDKMPSNHAGVHHGVGSMGAVQARNASPQRPVAGGAPGGGQGMGGGIIQPPGHTGAQQPARGNTNHATSRGWGGNEDEIGIGQGVGALNLGGQSSGYADRDVTPEQQEIARQQVEHFLLQRAQQAQQQAQQHRLPGQMGYHPMQGGFGGVQTLFGGNYSGSNNGSGILNNLQWEQQGGEAEAPSGAEAGSRLLAMLQGGSVEKRDERRDKPPLFLRSNGTDNRRGGHNMGGLGGEDHIQIPGMYQHHGMDNRSGGHNQEELGFLQKMDDSKEQNRQVETCAQCKTRTTGEIDQSDGCFYCDACWNAFVDWQSSQDSRPRNSRVR